jgi:hypothetical protein
MDELAIVLGEGNNIAGGILKIQSIDINIMNGHQCLDVRHRVLLKGFLQVTVITETHDNTNDMIPCFNPLLTCQNYLVRSTRKETHCPSLSTSY